MTSNVAGVAVPVPVPVPASGGDNVPAGPKKETSLGNWERGVSKFVQDHDRVSANRSDGVLFSFLAAMALGTAGSIAAHRIGKLRGHVVNDYGTWDKGLSRYTWGGGMIGAAVGAGGAWFGPQLLGSPKHTDPTLKLPERKLGVAYTDSRMPIVIPIGMPVGAVRGFSGDAKGSATSDLYSYSTRSIIGDKSKLDTETVSGSLNDAIEVARTKMLTKDSDGTRDSYAVLSVPGNGYQVARLRESEGKGIAGRFDRVEVVGTDPALRALVTPGAIYRD